LVRQQYIEQRADGPIVHVEVAPGIVTVVPAWMLDPVACAGMEIGAPRVAASTLADLHRLLTERGFRRSSRDDSLIVQEIQNEGSTSIRPGLAHRTTSAEDGFRVHATPADESAGTRKDDHATGQPADAGRRRRG